MKEKILRQILKTLQETLAIAKKGYEESTKDAQEAEGAMQSRYSTFKEESQYLLVGYAGKVNEITSIIEGVEKLLFDTICINNQVGVGSLVEVRNLNTSEEILYFIIRNGGGILIDLPEYKKEVFVISVQTPVAKSLINKLVGDRFKLAHTKNDEWVINRVL